MGLREALRPKSPRDVTDKGMKVCLPRLWGACREVLALRGLGHLSLVSALPSLFPALPAAASFPSYPAQVSPVPFPPVSTGKGTPLQLDAVRGRISIPKAQPSPPQAPSPTGRALVLTGDFQGTVELPPEPLQSRHSLQEKGSRVLRGRDGRAEVSTEATALMADPWRPWWCPGLALCHRHSL